MLPKPPHENDDRDSGDLADDLDVADEQQLVTLLDEFERALRAGRGPRIESFLARAAGRLRRPLLHDLIRLEQELLEPARKPTIERYQTRFPDDAPILRAALSTRVGYADAAESTILREPEKAQVDVVAGERLSLVAETAELLRTRLLAVSLIVVAGLGIFLIRAALYPGSQLVWLRAVAFLAAVFCSWRLSIARTSMIGSWRLLELVLIVVVGAQTVSLQVFDMAQAASAGDDVSVNTAMLFAFATWSVANMAYAILIPNNWRRAAAVLLPTAAVPLVVTVVLLTINEQIAAAVRQEALCAGSLLTFVASGAAIAGTYTVHSLRKQLYLARRFGQYRLTKRLGRGGMGEVYLAEHQLLKRPSAIKLIRPGFDTDADVVARFEREVQATAGLSHWNTVEIFDYGRTDDGAFYYVMEYLEGKSLQQLVDQDGPMPPGRVVFFLRQICDALAEAHHAGLVHQDLKPANIFAARCGSRYDVAKLLDFGLVQEVAERDHGSSVSTTTPRIVGTPRFMSPEQAQGIAPPDFRSDIYSLGATAFYLLTARPVFERESVAEVLRAHVDEKVSPPSRLCPNIPADLEAVILKCLAKRPEDRFRNVEEMAAALACCPGGDEWSAENAAEWWRRQESGG